jgi:two-component system, OmpR family, response regulator
VAKILMIEDDPKYAALITDYISAHRHTVDVAETVEEGLAFLDAYSYEILIVDWQLPDQEGPALIKALRKRGFATPIIMLTGRDALEDKEQGFTAGADDYLSKNASVKELLLRVDALLRRPALLLGKTIQVRNVQIDIANHIVTKDNVEVHLQPQEFAVLEFLVRYPNRVFSAEELLDRLWPSDTEATTHTVRSHVNKIRSKLDNDNGTSLIATKYKAGYQINLEEP